MNSASYEKPRSISFKFMNLFMFALVALPFVSLAQSAEVRNALKQIDKEQPSKGVVALEQLASKGDNSNTLYYLGLGYLRTGNTEKALAAFEKGISVNDKDGLNYAGKAQVRLSEKKSNEGKMLVDKALSLSKSKNAEVLRAVGEALMADSRTLVDAISNLNKSKSINNADPETHMLLGEAYLMQNNGGESVTAYERAASADARWGKPHHKVARVYQRSKNNALVMENLTKAVAVDPQYAPAWKALADQYYLQKDPLKGIDALKQYMAVSENAEEAKTQLAFFYIMARRFDEADAIFKEVLGKPNPPAIAYKFAGLALLEKDTTRASAEKAIPLLEQYFKKARPEDIQALDYAYAGKANLRAGKDSLANESFVKSLALDSAQQDIAELHANTYYKRKKLTEAIKAYKHLMSIRKQPLSGDYWSLGRAYYYNQQFAEADSAFSKLAERQPTVTLGFLWAAKSRIQLDPDAKQGLAKPMYDKVVEIGLQKPDKNKKDLIEAYEYLGTYAVQIEGNVAKATEYFDKILQIDPNHARAKEFKELLKK